MDSSRAFLGKGFAFPPEVDPVTGHFRMAEGEEDIRQAIYIILMTRLKERAMLPDFGCNLQEYIYDLFFPLCHAEFSCHRIDFRRKCEASS